MSLTSKVVTLVKCFKSFVSYLGNWVTEDHSDSIGGKFYA